MKKTDDPVLDEIHAIRRQIYEEIKDMTSSERTAYFKQSCDAALKECGYIKIYTDENKTRFRIESDPNNIQAMKRHAEIEKEINEIRRQNGEKIKDTACSEQTELF
ncbi:MAG: hypothetical protein FWH46_02475 [Methanimicrococcus sp.]|nr:hypothetical protein [Methanimicrococcus sp.]